jgi:hypothetical protein
LQATIETETAASAAQTSSVFMFILRGAPPPSARELLYEAAFKHRVGVLRRVDVGPHGDHLPVLADQEAVPRGEAILEGHAERLRDGLAVDRERKGQVMFVDERLVARRVLCRDAEDLDPRGLEAGPGVLDAVRLDGAALGVVLRVEIDEHVFALEAWRGRPSDRRAA